MFRKTHFNLLLFGQSANVTAQLEQHKWLGLYRILNHGRGTKVPLNLLVHMEFLNQRWMQHTWVSNYSMVTKVYSIIKFPVHKSMMADVFNTAQCDKHHKCKLSTPFNHDPFEKFT